MDQSNYLKDTKLSLDAILGIDLKTVNIRLKKTKL